MCGGVKSSFGGERHNLIKIIPVQKIKRDNKMGKIPGLNVVVIWQGVEAGKGGIQRTSKGRKLERREDRLN